MMKTVVPHPIVAPGKCFQCGNAYPHDGRKYLDTGATVDGYGAVYVCELCVADYGTYFNLVPAENVVNAVKETATYVAKLKEAVEENERLRSALRELPLVGDPSRFVVPEPPAAEPGPAVDQGASEREARPAQSTDVRRPARLYSSDTRQSRRGTAPKLP